MLPKRGIAASIATIWLAVWASTPFAAVHVLTHHQTHHHEDSALAGHNVGFDHTRGHDHGEKHSHPTLQLTAGTSPRPPAVRDVVGPSLPVVFSLVEGPLHQNQFTGRHHQRPPALHASVATTVLRI